jgi:hypothetical protein
MESRRQCDLRTDLCNRFQSLPGCDQQQRFTGGLSGAGSDSLAKSVFDRGQQRQQFFADRIHTSYRHQPHSRFSPAAERNLATNGSAGFRCSCARVHKSEFEVGQILDADIYFNPGDSLTSFATPQALGTHTKSYDLESTVTHELPEHTRESAHPRKCPMRL